MVKKSFILLVLISSCGLLFYSCQYSDEPVQIIIKTESVRLEWDPPQVERLVALYKIYYRSEESLSWVMLDVIVAVEYPTYEIYHSDLGNGFYDFAVQAVYIDGWESSLHTSLDQNANPINGWRLFWVISE